MSTWRSSDTPPSVDIPPLGWILVVLRAIPLVLLFAFGLAVFLLLRGIEHFALKNVRSISPFIVQTVNIVALRIIGLRLRVEGTPFRGPGAKVANHSSWLDILVLNAADRVFFVSKADVEGWPVIGFMARVAGTLFIRRAATDAATQREQFIDRLKQGHQLMFFPEGTSSDGLRVLPFKSTLFAAFFVGELRNDMAIQPVSVSYEPAKTADPRFYGWWGDMEFGEHLLCLLASRRRGHAHLVFHDTLKVEDFSDRKKLSAACEARVRAAHHVTPAGQSMLEAQL